MIEIATTDKEVLTDLANKIKLNEKVYYVWLFGSYARYLLSGNFSELHEGSDIDLAIFVDIFISMEDLKFLRKSLPNDILDRKIHYVFTCPGKFPQGKRIIL